MRIYVNGRGERCMVRAMCAVQLKRRKRAKDLMLGLIDTMDRLTVASSVRWYGHVFRGAGGRMAMP